MVLDIDWDYTMALFPLTAYNTKALIDLLYKDALTICFTPGDIMITMADMRHETPITLLLMIRNIKCGYLFS